MALDISASPSSHVLIGLFITPKDDEFFQMEGGIFSSKKPQGHQIFFFMRPSEFFLQRASTKSVGYDSWPL